METMLIRVLNQKALKLLEDLEALELIKMVRSEANQSDRFAGKLPSDIAEAMQKHIAESREEWSSRNT